MDPMTESVIVNIVIAVGVLGLAGILVGWRIVAGKHKLEEHKLVIEEMRLENEARALDVEQQRLRLVLDDHARSQYNQLPR